MVLAIAKGQNCGIKAKDTQNRQHAIKNDSLYTFNFIIHA